MWNKERVTVVVPTKNNSGTIRYVIEDLFLTGYVDDLIVIDIHSSDNTINEVSYTKARLLSADSIKEAISLGIERAKGELVVFMDAAGNYKAGDIQKLLSFSADFDVVLASRTQDVGYSRNMKLNVYSRFILNASIKLSKRLSSSLVTDVDSDVFLIRRLHYLNKRFFLEYNDDFWFAELIVRTIKNNSRFIQVPLDWKGDFSQRHEIMNLFSRLKYFYSLSRIINDKSPRSVIVENSSVEQDLKKEVIPVEREFTPEYVAPVKVDSSGKKNNSKPKSKIKSVSMSKKELINRAIKRYNTKVKSKPTSSKKSTGKKDLKKGLKKEIKLVSKQENEFKPDEF